MPADGLRRTADLEEWWSDRALAGPASIDTAQPRVARALLKDLLGDRLIDLPLPGQGRTLARFEALATLGELDLTVGRLVEAHVDALAILAELDASGDVSDPRQIWAVWAAEPPSPRVEANQHRDGHWTLSGRKPWCSGAGAATRALVTANTGNGARLFAVNVTEPAVVPADDNWPAAALSGTDTRSVDFADAAATAIGGPDDYVQRPGFWYGATGVAAVWHGGARAVARRLVAAARSRDMGDIGAAHLGAVAASLSAAGAVLHESARMIDAGELIKPPKGEVYARCVRAVVEDAATRVIDQVGRALGPAPLAMDGVHARRVADLQLYLRQSHAERDLASLGRRIAETESAL